MIDVTTEELQEAALSIRRDRVFAARDNLNQVLHRGPRQGQSQDELLERFDHLRDVLLNLIADGGSLNIQFAVDFPACWSIFEGNDAEVIRQRAIENRRLLDDDCCDEDD